MYGPKCCVPPWCVVRPPYNASTTTRRCTDIFAMLSLEHFVDRTFQGDAENASYETRSRVNAVLLHFGRVTGQEERVSSQRRCASAHPSICSRASYGNAARCSVTNSGGASTPALLEERKFRVRADVGAAARRKLNPRSD